MMLFTRKSLVHANNNTTTHHICVAESVQAHLDECAILFMQAHRGRRIYLKVLRGRTSKFIIISAHKSVKCRRYIWGMMPKHVRNLCENMYRLSSFMFMIC